MENDRPMLVLQEGHAEPGRWPIEKDVTTLGRLPDNDVVLADRLISRHHACIRRDGTQLFLEDLESTNGTYVNGERVGESHLLQDGDTIQLPPRFQLRFVDRASTVPMPGLQRSQRLEIDEAEREVTIGGEAVELSVAQYQLLCLLVSNEGRVVSRPELVRTVWAEDEAAGITNQAVDALVRRLRERLAVVDPEHSYVQTVRGHGFKFENR